MSLQRRLARWVDAELITAEQAQRIVAFEQGNERPTFVYAVAGLAGLAIAIGLLSIVAANWDAIPGRVKVGIDLVLVALLAYGIARLDRDGPRWVAEAAVLAMYGLVLASIALLGQVYQLGGRAHEALLTWSLLTAVLMSRAHSGLGAAVGVVGWQVTFTALAIHWGDRLSGLDSFVASTFYWVPLACITVGRSAWIRARRPALATVCQAIGWTELVLAATVGTFVFYGDTAREDWGPMALGAMVSLAWTVWLIARTPASPAQAMVRVLLGVCLLLAHLPWPISRGDLDLVAALTFIGLWLLVARTAHRARETRVLNLATALIGLRILSVYFEVFGSLLDTGIGLVVGGLLTLALVWLWVRKRRDFGRELASGAPS